MADSPQQHSDHVPTVPTPGVAPEYHHYPVNKEPNATVQSDDINIPLVLASVIVSVILLFEIVTWLEGWYYGSMAEQQQAIMVPSEALMKMRTDQQEQLNKPHWVMEPKHIATIPIDQAIDMVAAQYKNGPPEGNKQ